MPDCCDGVVQYHALSAPPHHVRNPSTHILPIAMNSATSARRFPFSMRTARQSSRCVIKQLSTFLTQSTLFRCVTMPATEHLYHDCYRCFLSINMSSHQFNNLLRDNKICDVAIPLDRATPHIYCFFVSCQIGFPNDYLPK